MAAAVLKTTPKTIKTKNPVKNATAKKAATPARKSKKGEGKRKDKGKAVVKRTPASRSRLPSPEEATAAEAAEAA